MLRLVWGITGSGSFIRDLVELFIDLKKQFPNLVVAVALSRAGRDVCRIYGVLEKLRLIAAGGRYGGLYIDEGPNSWMPLVGRVSLGRYDLIIIAPATSNTVAKIVHGISDTLITVVVSQALKSGTPVVVFPSDYAGEARTQLPCRIDISSCTKCYACLKSSFCSHNAIILGDQYPAIDYSKCVGCGKCSLKCPSGAIRCWEEIIVKPSPIDIANLSKLMNTPGVQVLHGFDEVCGFLMKFIGQSIM